MKSSLTILLGGNTSAVLLIHSLFPQKLTVVLLPYIKLSTFSSLYHVLVLTNFCNSKQNKQEI